MSKPDAAVELSSSCTVAQYRQLEAKKDRKAIAAFLIKRFEERYVTPVGGNSKTKHGFTIMAISCLMIEALECFRLGRADNRNKSKSTFKSFFAEWKEFAEFRNVDGAFYTGVRCGILHQAETTGGWRIRRTGQLLDDKTINATKFLEALRAVLHAYADQLRNEDWDSSVLWKNFRDKMNSVCENTKP